MERDFMQVVKSIKEVAPKNLVNALDSHTGLWAPEIVWCKLSEYVNRYVAPSSKDATSVAVYARLCDCSEADMKSRFEACNM